MSVRNAEFQIISALRTNRTKRSQEKEVFVEGTEPIKQLLTAGWKITRILFREKTALSSWAKEVIQNQSDAKIFEVKDELYLELSEKETPSELIVTAKIKNQLDLNGLIQKKSLLPNENPFYLLFDRPSDYGNFGTLLRSADAFLVDIVFVIGHSIDVYDPKVIRSSLGSLFHTQLVFVPNFETLNLFVESEKKRSGLSVIGTDSSGEFDLREKTLTSPILLILGNEKKGMSVQLQSLCDSLVKIPMFGVVNSLNVSCAGSILLWEVTKGRGSQKTNQR
ncbi:TrmH family RNA methyltransferase [Leptospira levettii]|uniref:RNA methyltransferase n=1 Tax=Leptospira levettii TaxID=2023178 RepID=A0AAW5VDH3_9LEPT|nr:TrmH family RNA methyltransferase [Leptospira levettii]MCW7466173.1 RNA methyltransferase [Leptospira levettii]MCW7512302.1 RNA methyltransferase [Leptospira levettii]MCW7516310.1 RNA methyltransferase [Leptospira levettii]